MKTQLTFQYFLQRCYVFLLEKGNASRSQGGFHSVVVLDSDYQVGAVGLGEERVHVFHINSDGADDLDDPGKSAGAVLQFAADDVGDLNYMAFFLKGGNGLIDIVHDQPEDAEILSLGNGERADIYVIGIKAVGDLL